MLLQLLGKLLAGRLVLFEDDKGMRLGEATGRCARRADRQPEERAAQAERNGDLVVEPPARSSPAAIALVPSHSVTAGHITLLLLSGELLTEQ
jgi:hypothetical protein